MKVLFCSKNLKSIFKLHDINLLKKNFNVIELDFGKYYKFKSLIFSVIKSIFTSYDIIIFYFADVYFTPIISLIAKLKRKKIIIFAGGDDIANVAIINWGKMKTWWKRIIQKFNFFICDYIIAFSFFSYMDICKLAKKNKINVIYPEINVDFYKPNEYKKENLIITTCVFINKISYIQKGIDIFIKSAKYFPNFTFLIIGEVDKNDIELKNIIINSPKNVVFTNRFISEEEKLRYFQQSKVYVQASAHEGFGIAVAEAMSCECIPIGAMYTSLWEVIGDAGY